MVFIACGFRALTDDAGHVIGLKESGATSTGPLAGGDGQVEIAQESADVFFDVVADRAHRVQRLPGRVGQGPFFVAFPGHSWGRHRRSAC